MSYQNVAYHHVSICAISAAYRASRELPQHSSLRALDIFGNQ